MIIYLLPLRVPSVAGFSNKDPKTISGTVKKNGVINRANVHLYERISGNRVASTLADNEGFYEFKNLSNEYKFFITSHDPSSQFNAVIQDNVVPK